MGNDLHVTGIQLKNYLTWKKMLSIHTVFVLFWYFCITFTIIAEIYCLTLYWLEYVIMVKLGSRGSQSVTLCFGSYGTTKNPVAYATSYPLTLNPYPCSWPPTNSTNYRKCILNFPST